MKIKEQFKPVPKPRTFKSIRPIPKPRKSVKQMAQEYEDNIILPPIQFRDGYKPIPMPRTTKQVLDKPVPLPRTKKLVLEKPIPLPRTKIEQTKKAIEGYTKSFEIAIKSEKDPLKQLQSTRKAINQKLKKILIVEKGFKSVETLKVTFEKTTSKDETTIKTAYFNSTSFTIANENELDKEFQESQKQIINKIAQWISEGSGWTIESVNNHYINIINYDPLRGSSYVNLPQEFNNSAKGF